MRKRLKEIRKQYGNQNLEIRFQISNLHTNFRFLLTNFNNRIGAVGQLKQ